MFRNHGGIQFISRWETIEKKNTVHDIYLKMILKTIPFFQSCANWISTKFKWSNRILEFVNSINFFLSFLLSSRISSLSPVFAILGIFWLEIGALPQDTFRSDSAENQRKCLRRNEYTLWPGYKQYKRAARFFCVLFKYSVRIAAYLLCVFIQFSRWFNYSWCALLSFSIRSVRLQTCARDTLLCDILFSPFWQIFWYEIKILCFYLPFLLSSVSWNFSVSFARSCACVRVNHHSPTILDSFSPQNETTHFYANNCIWKTVCVCLFSAQFMYTHCENERKEEVKKYCALSRLWVEPKTWTLLMNRFSLPWVSDDFHQTLVESARHYVWIS